MIELPPETIFDKQMDTLRLIRKKNPYIAAHPPVYNYFLEQNKPDLIGKDSWRIVNIDTEIIQELGRYLTK